MPSWPQTRHVGIHSQRVGQMPLSPSYRQSREYLSTSMENIHGVGPRVFQKLAKLGVFKVEDALYTLPFRYEDRRVIRKIECQHVGRAVFALKTIVQFAHLIVVIKNYQCRALGFVILGNPSQDTRYFSRRYLKSLIGEFES